MSMDNAQRLRQVNENLGPFNRHVGLRAEAVGRGTCRLICEIRQEHLNPRGTVHGGMNATMLDVAGGIAAIYAGDEPRQVVTQSSDAHYLRPLTGTMIIAEGRVIRAGRHTCLARAASAAPATWSCFISNKTVPSLAGRNSSGNAPRCAHSLAMCNNRLQDVRHSHTCGASSVFSEVHAPGRNVFELFFPLRREKSEGRSPLNSPPYHRRLYLTPDKEKPDVRPQNGPRIRFFQSSSQRTSPLAMS